MEKRIDILQKEGILKPQEAKGNINQLKLGEELIGWEYEAPFDSLPLVKETLKGYVHRVIDGEDVVTDVEGTGLLHVAPGAGGEDFKLGIKNKLPVISSIEEDASYFSTMGEFARENAKKHPELIFDYLKNKHEEISITLLDKP